MLQAFIYRDAAAGFLIYEKVKFRYALPNFIREKLSFMYENLIFIHENDDFLCANCNFVHEAANFMHENLFFIAAIGILKVAVCPLRSFSLNPFPFSAEKNECRNTPSRLNLD